MAYKKISDIPSASRQDSGTSTSGSSTFNPSVVTWSGNAPGPKNVLKGPALAKDPNQPQNSLAGQFSGFIPLYNAGTGAFVGWQSPGGQNIYGGNVIGTGAAPVWSQQASAPNQGTPGPGPGPQLAPVQLTPQPTPTPAIQPQLAQTGLTPPQPSGQPFAQAPPQGNVLNPIPIQPIPVQQYQSGGLVTDPYQPYGPPQPIPGYNNPPVGYYDAATQAQAARQAQQQAGSPLLSGTQQAQLANVPPVPATMYTQGNMLYAPGQSGLIETGQPTYYGNATTLGSQLGAAALNMPMVIDLPPSGSPDIKSGVSKVRGTLIGSGVPSVPQGPWLTNPSVFARAPMPKPTATQPITPTAQPGGIEYMPGQAFAAPPPAPGYTLGAAMPQTSVPAPQTPWLAQGGMGGGGQPSAWGIPPAPGQGAGYVPEGFLQAHTSALANAGMALYSHFGGDPNTASPADIANFHTQLSGAVGQHIAGANQGSAETKKMGAGGMVPGRGSGDIVPALLEPGEYVIPREQVNQLVARGALKMQSGGVVPDNQSNEPPEARRQALTVQSGNASQPSSSSAQRSSIQEGSSLVSGLTQAAQTYGNSFSGSMGGAGMGGRGGYTADTLGKLGDEPLIGSMGLGQGFGGGGGGLSSPAAQNALGGVASGLGQAAQAIASSVKPWQMQQSAIPDPSQLPKYQVPTLQPERVA